MADKPVEADKSATGRASRLVRLGVFPAILLAGGITWSWWPGGITDSAGSGSGHATDPEQGSAGPGDASSPGSEAALSEDERMTDAIVGHWETDRDSGHRELIMRSDGTALMTVEIDSLVSRLAFGPRMEIDIEWSISDGVLHFRMVGGRPKQSVDTLTRVGGSSLAYKILILNDKRLLVKDGGSDPDHDWTRVAE